MSELVKTPAWQRVPAVVAELVGKGPKLSWRKMADCRGQLDVVVTRSIGM